MILGCTAEVISWQWRLDPVRDPDRAKPFRPLGVVSWPCRDAEDLLKIEDDNNSIANVLSKFFESPSHWLAE